MDEVATKQITKTLVLGTYFPMVEVDNLYRAPTFMGGAGGGRGVFKNCI